MAEDILRMHVGTTLQLQRISPDNDDRYAVTLIGYLAGSGFVVTTPAINGKVLFFKEGQRFAVRLLEGSTIQGFVSTILHCSSKPYPHLHLSYPAEVESIAVRDSERVETRLLALAHNTAKPDSDDNWLPVLVRDISSSGARIESADPPGQVGEKLELRFETEVCGSQEHFSLLAELRNRTLKEDQQASEGSRYISGISFFHVNRFQELLLNSLILEQKNNRQ